MVIMKNRRSSENKGDKSRHNGSNATTKSDSGDLSDEENQGFGNWLRSSTGIEMMRLFVIANSILVFVTMGWPNEEYRKYPRMRADVESVEAVDKRSAPNGLPAESSLSRSITECSDPDAVCPVDIADTCQRTTASNGRPKEAVAGGTSENAVAVGAGSTDKNAFSENAAQLALESRKLPSSSDTHDEERRPGVIHQDGDREERAIGGSEIGVLASSPRRLEKPRRRLGKRGLSGVSKKARKDMSREKARKRRVNTIVLTNADFVGARIDSDDDDFSEFEEEGGGQRVLKEGILVSELPFKPKADIGDLDRVTAEEFCPLTLEDEVSCGETTTWP